jgi:hypothetical protein
VVAALDRLGFLERRARATAALLEAVVDRAGVIAPVHRARLGLETPREGRVEQRQGVAGLVVARLKGVKTQTSLRLRLCSTRV